MNYKSKIFDSLIQIFRDPLRLSLDLFKIMVPIIIAVKICQELDMIKYLAVPLAPVMWLVGLPRELGLVWATAILNNLYGAIIVLLSLVHDTQITTAQATVLCTMMLVAHSLPIELKIAQASGPRLLFQAFSRLGAAVLFGWILNLLYSGLNLLRGPLVILIGEGTDIRPQKLGLYSWAAGELRNLIYIFIVIVGLFLLMRILKRFKIIDYLNLALRPVLRFMGIGPKASAIAMIGLTLGISFGGGLIIHEARTGQVGKRDVFFSLTLMGLSHSLIEDTLLMVMVGGHLSGILIARLIFSIAAVALLVRASGCLPNSFCDRFLWGEPK